MKMYRFMWLMAMLVVSAAFVACSKDGGRSGQQGTRSGRYHGAEHAE